MADQRKRDLIRAYKEKTPKRGACAVRCTATGQVWVLASPNLEAQERSTWFMLKSGSHINRTLQQTWNTEGEQAFHFEILATLDDSERSDYALKADLKELETTWLGKLQAAKLAG